MRLTVRVFGVLAERIGAAERELELPDGATAAELLDAATREAPAVGELRERVSVAVNLEVVPLSRRLREGDEVALLPPVAGGGARILTGLRAGAAAVDEALGAVAAPGAGGTVVFVGTVRDENEGAAVERLEYSAYAAMAERVLAEVAEETAEKWGLHGVAILHATGVLAVGQPTVVVACSAAHRAEAFEACRHAIDEVKRRAPIWKKETGPGGGRWVGV